MRRLWFWYGDLVIAVLCVLFVGGLLLLGYGAIYWGSMGTTTPNLDDGVYHAVVADSSYTEGFMFSKGILNVFIKGQEVRIETGWSLRLKRMYIESKGGDLLILTVKNKQVREFRRLK